MKIGPLENGPIGPHLEDLRKQGGEKPAPEQKNDRIDISSEARAKLAARQPDADSVRQSSAADAPNRVRLDLIRQRIESRFYDREEVKALIAEKLH